MTIPLGEAIISIPIGIGIIAWAIIEDKKWEKRFEPIEREFYQRIKEEVTL